MLKGYDLSAYQGTTVPTCDFAIIKATEGKSYTSSKFTAQWKSAGSNAKHCGAYHFARPEASSASSQADRFLDVVKPVAGESLWLDLEASDLSQAKTHAWAVAFADRLRDQAPGITYGIYMGSGYATNNTGRGLADEYPLWWYPQYPTAAKTSTWPSSFSPWLPSGLTCGWAKPHIWQFSSAFHGEYDASVTTLTLDQLAGGKAPDPKPAGPPKWPGRYLKLASPLMHGSDVKWVQQRLNSHGASPKVTVDSQYGPKTRDAVRAFQRKQKLEVDGIVGAKTWAALGK